MNVLILCNTPLQLINSLQIKHEFFANDNVDLVLTDSIANVQKLYDKVANKRIFNRVYLSNVLLYKNVWTQLKFTYFPSFYTNEIKKIIPALGDTNYEIFLIANISGVSTCIATYLKYKFGTKIAIYEDGFVVYSDHYKNVFKESVERKTARTKYVYFLKKEISAFIKDFYVYYPEKIEAWNLGINAIKVPHIGDDVRKIINELFDVDKCPDKYEQSVVFFEESYYADGHDVDDVSIIEKIAELVGKENIIVKIHPRNPVNRFKHMGFATNIDTTTPWEAIALNIDMSNKYLITIASGSSAVSYYLTGKRGKKSIFLYEMEGMEMDKLSPVIPIYNQLCKNDSYFAFPHNYSELLQVFSDHE